MMLRINASSEESVGVFWLWKLAEYVTQRELGDPEHPIAVRFSRCHFGFVVQALDDAAGELLLDPEIVEHELPVRTHRAGKLLHRIDARERWLRKFRQSDRGTLCFMSTGRRPEKAEES